MDLRTTYLGLALPSPVIASASPLTGRLENLRALEDAGAGAVVLPSIFAEQIASESSDSGQETPFFSAPQHYSMSTQAYLDLIRQARAALAIPVIASLNGVSETDWVDYAALLQEAGASALELNLHCVPAKLEEDGRAVEQRYLNIVAAVRSRVSLPLAVKVGPAFSSTGNMALKLIEAGADGLVLFNRFYQPDIDLWRLKQSRRVGLSYPEDMRQPLLWIALLRRRLGGALAASSGVGDAEHVVKYLLAGADVVMSTSALLRHGPAYMRTLVDGLAEWLERRGMASPAAIRGLLSQASHAGSSAEQRANYIRLLQGYKDNGAAGQLP